MLKLIWCFIFQILRFQFTADYHSLPLTAAAAAAAAADGADDVRGVDTP
jgi:hypothetical protein